MLLRVGLLAADSVRGGSMVIGDGGLNVVLLSSASGFSSFSSSDRILATNTVRNRPIGNAGFLRGGFIVRGMVVLREADSPRVGVVGFSP